MSIYSSRLIGVLVIVTLFFVSFPAKADDGVLPSEVFTAIMLKALNYDRNLERLAKEKVVIGVVSSSDDAPAQGFSTQVKDNIDKVQSTFLLKGKPVDVNVFSLEKVFDKAKFEEQLKQANVSVLIVAAQDLTFVNNVTEVTKNLQLSSICGAPGCAQRGIGLEIVQKDNRPHMSINLNSAKLEGSDYDSKLLAMCDVVK